MSHPTLYMTEKGFTKIETNLNRLRTKRIELATDLGDSYNGGDSIDNTEYLLLRDEAAYVQERINELEDVLRHAEIITCGQPDGKVHLGNTVIIQSGEDPVESYTIVGRVEADPSAGYISNECPLGAALLEHAIGEDVTVATPDGEIVAYRILAVT
ncbi:MAG: GreA/GreB family elongation factor [Candidatus Promineifilaceae bacterium]|nr:GreA/GreB family elongation factor [Candidatus Promineifilaceae bacterium]